MENLRPAEMDSPLNRRVRAFLALGPPPDEWLDALEQWLTPLKRRLTDKGVRWTNREGLHMTLRFFGSVSLYDTLQIQERAEEMARHFKVMIFFEAPKLLFFPSPSKPRIMALDLWDSTRQVEALESSVRKKFFEFGKPPEERPFRPHLTIARLERISMREMRIVTDAAGPKLPPWTAREMTLFESKLQPGGSVYTPLAKFPFG
jgi:2'-5' RNA ligase